MSTTRRPSCEWARTPTHCRTHTHTHTLTHTRKPHARTHSHARVHPRCLTDAVPLSLLLCDGRWRSKLGLHPPDVLRALSAVYSDSIFLHGFVHCDPHGGNVLVRVQPGTNKPQIVMLDHGLYRCV